MGRPQADYYGGVWGADDPSGKKSDMVTYGGLTCQKIVKHHQDLSKSCNTTIQLHKKIINNHNMFGKGVSNFVRTFVKVRQRVSGFVTDFVKQIVRKFVKVCKSSSIPTPYTPKSPYIPAFRYNHHAPSPNPGVLGVPVQSIMPPPPPKPEVPVEQVLVPGTRYPMGYEQICATQIPALRDE